MNKIIFSLLLLCCFKAVLAQDVQFTQVLNAPLYLNPAYAGTQQTSRAQLNHRGQWLGMPGYFISTAVAADFYLAPRNRRQKVFRNAGVGVVFLHDIAGSARLTNNYVAASFASETRINPLLSLRMSAQLGIGQRSFNTNDLIFSDMLKSDGLTGLPTAESNLGLTNAIYPDITWGSLLYSPNWQLGLAIHHINQPSQSFINENAILPMLFTAHFGYQINLDGQIKTNQEPKQYVKPFIMYRRQGRYDQLDIGSNIYLDPLVLGLWYRGLAIKKESVSWNNQDAISLYVGSKWDMMELGVSYDVTISQLGTSKTGGSYELSMKYLLSKPKAINGFTVFGAKGVECESYKRPKGRPSKRVGKR